MKQYRTPMIWFLMFTVVPTSASVGQGQLDFDSLNRLSMRHWRARSTQFERAWVQRITKLLTKRMVGFPKDRQISDLAVTIVRLCRKYQIDPVLVLSMIHHESSFNPRALSVMGARGLMQLMPGTAQFVIDHLLDGKMRTSFQGGSIREQLEDPFFNVTLGVAYLAYLRNRYTDNLPQFLAAYNAGPGAVDDRLDPKLDLGPSFERWRAVHPYIQAISRSVEMIRSSLGFQDHKYFKHVSIAK